MVKTKKKVVLKTKKNSASVSTFLAKIKDPEKRKDAQALLKLFKEVTKEKPTMWGSSIVGFGEYTYVSPATGRTGDWMMTGFSPRAQNLTIYIMRGYSSPEYQALLKKLGKHSLGKSCLYIKRLSDIHLPTLKTLVARGYRDMQKKYN